MKTSFYFVLWIIIYPLLGLLHSNFIDNNSFIVALGIVIGMSWLLNRFMPDTLTYERILEIAPILEDVYTRNVSSFKKRLSREARIETVTAIYFMVTTAVILLAILKADVDDWVALIIFVFFTFGAISRSTSLLSARSLLKSNPTAEQCAEIADNTYKLDYAAYYESHEGRSYEEMLPPRPKYYKVFRIFSVVMAALASLLGLLYIVSALLIMISNSTLEAGALASMYFLYGSLAAYFGVKDFIACIHTGPRKPSAATTAPSATEESAALHKDTM